MSLEAGLNSSSESSPSRLRCPRKWESRCCFEEAFAVVRLNFGDTEENKCLLGPGRTQDRFV